MTYKKFMDIFFVTSRLVTGPASLAIVLGVAFCASVAAQDPAGKPAAQPDRPRLVVVVSVDQYCQDYLVRFAENLEAQKGFVATVRKQGLEFAECHHRHAFTVTAPGHSVQLTGSYPNVNGIVGNNWYDAILGSERYCVADPTVQVVGNPTGTGMSPRSLLVETMGDSLKRTFPKSKVFGIAIKDRAAILMSGHRADSAFWMAGNRWITSTYYRNDLPPYLRMLNEGKAIDAYRSKSWTLLYPLEKYKNTVAPDKNDWENPPVNYTSEFPHNLYKPGEGTEENFGEQVLFSPFGNELTLQAARAIVEGELLGKDDSPDVLTINLSSNDYVGHAFGPDSLEVEDMVYRTDLQLKGFADFLNEQVGAGDWVMSLTADHGVAPIVEFAAQNKLPASRNPLGVLADLTLHLEGFLRAELHLPPDISPIQKIEDCQIYLRHGDKGLQGAQRQQAAELLRDWMMNQHKVAMAATRADLLTASQNPLHAALSKACHPQRSGDVLFVFRPYTVPGNKGTTHGSPWRYDTHVPLMLLGHSIPAGKTDHTPVSPAYLAATMAKLCGCATPTSAVEPALDLTGELPVTVLPSSSPEPK